MCYMITWLYPSVICRKLGMAGIYRDWSKLHNQDSIKPHKVKCVFFPIVNIGRSQLIYGSLSIMQSLKKRKRYQQYIGLIKVRWATYVPNQIFLGWNLESLMLKVVYHRCLYPKHN